MNKLIFLLVFALIFPLLVIAKESLTDQELIKIAYKAIKRRYNVIHSSKYKPYVIQERTDTTLTISGTWNMPANCRGGTPFVIIRMDGKIIKISHGK
ncbi:MAG TPA: NTF2 fold immunity protein [Chitinophagales bacterium]|nr:NTF2 fold immunity protein [Chitinophagales bacterium]